LVGGVLDAVWDCVGEGDVDGVLRLGALGVGLLDGGVSDGVGLVEGVLVGDALGVGVGDGDALRDGGDWVG
jgi:hypothetical protein